MSVTEVDQSKILIGAKTVRQRYGDSSDMTLWRWLHDEKMGFPQPLRINGRRFWRLTDLEEWERSRASASGAA
jgi:predicted DNA-binding transcriptional regulator AlpA